MNFRELVSYLIAFSSSLAIPFLLYDLFKYPINTGRILLYTSLLIALILIVVDLGFNEVLSQWINKRLSYKWSLIISSLIIVVAFATISLWSINYAVTVLKTRYTRNSIGEMYPSDIGALYIAWIPLTLYGIYCIALYIYNHHVKKQFNHQLTKHP